MDGHARCVMCRAVGAIAAVVCIVQSKEVQVVKEKGEMSKRISISILLDIMVFWAILINKFVHAFPTFLFRC